MVRIATQLDAAQLEVLNIEFNGDGETGKDFLEDILAVNIGFTHVTTEKASQIIPELYEERIVEAQGFPQGFTFFYVCVFAQDGDGRITGADVHEEGHYQQHRQ